jgi:putative addiction module antidote
MYQLKITTIGSSAGVILPKHVLEKLRVGKGDTLCLTEMLDGFRITPYDKEFAEAMDAAEVIMRENREALRALAK